MLNGRAYDPETGLYYYRTRYLDPCTGRFTIRDTIGIWGDPQNLGNEAKLAGRASNPGRDNNMPRCEPSQNAICFSRPLSLHCLRLMNW